ncbi:Metal transporter nramp1 [Cyanidiococcus yangmingshanensis]|uniref:Metal transporter nramp1 n=1 Tax=Cyanidiococcus yangmingshanensis TaxID=2690220 RepID=A0A7J7IC11_9RHOD|nr:Metal transporter nramp1 [Cyanidiococcus yangmingshanensis]
MECKAPAARNARVGWRKRLHHDAKVLKRVWRYMGPGWLVCVAYLDPANLFADIQSGTQYAYSQLWVIWWSQWFALFVGWLGARLVLSQIPLEDFGTLECKHYRKPTMARYLLWIFAELIVVVTDIPEVIGFAFGMHIISGILIWAGVLLSFAATLLVLLTELGSFRYVEAAVALCVVALGITLLVSLTRSGLDVERFFLGWLLPRFQGAGSVSDALNIVGSVVMPHNLYLQTGSLIAHHTTLHVARNIFSKLDLNTQDKTVSESEPDSFSSESADTEQGTIEDLESKLSESGSLSRTELEAGPAMSPVLGYHEAVSTAERFSEDRRRQHGAVQVAGPLRSAFTDPYPLASDEDTISVRRSWEPYQSISQPALEQSSVFKGAIRPNKGQPDYGYSTFGRDGNVPKEPDVLRIEQCAAPALRHAFDVPSGCATGQDVPATSKTAEGLPVNRLSVDATMTQDEFDEKKTPEKDSDLASLEDTQSIGKSADADPARFPKSIPRIGPVVLELAFPTLFAFFVNAAAISIAARSGQSQASQNLSNIGLYNFCDLLPFEGACVLWGIILLVSGTAATVTVTLTGSYVMSGFLQMRIPMLLRATLARGIAILPALIIAATSSAATVNAIIGIVNTILSVSLPIVLVPLLRCVHERRQLHWFPLGAGWLFTAFIFGLNLYSFCAPQGGMFGLYTGNGSNFTWSVQANILQDMVILLYVGAVAWLAVA